MMTQVLQQKVSRRRPAVSRPRPAFVYSPRRPGAALAWRRLQRHILRALGRMALPLVRALKSVPRPGGKPKSGMPRKMILPDTLKGAAAGALVLVVFSCIAAGIAPLLRRSTLSLSLPEETLEASVLNAFLEGPAPQEEGFQTPAGAGEFRSLSVRNHSIRSGETISGIAGKAGLALDTVISFNHIQNALKIPAGTQLKLPDRNGILYTVKRGDSLFSIAKAYSITTNAIADANNLESSTIHAGQELFIPGARMQQHELKKILGELFINPAAAGRLTSRFGTRPDPFTRVPRFHNGIDLAAKEGSPILAAMAGKVVKVGVHATYGRYIIVSHAGGYQSWYAHLRKPLVEQGRSVEQGQLIGEMGNTGYSTGPHLHFSIFKDGSPVDPLKFLQ